MEILRSSGETNFAQFFWDTVYIDNHRPLLIYYIDISKTAVKVFRQTHVETVTDIYLIAIFLLCCW